MDWRKVPMTMLTAYFDASGSENTQPVLAVAGFLACADAWVAFEKTWLGRLKKDNLAYFHTTEFNASRGQFKDGWKDNEPRRVALITDLVQIISGHVHRQFGAVVVNEQIKNQFSESEREKWFINSYALAGRTCGSQVRLWARADGQRVMPELVFEDGDKGKGVLIEVLRRDSFPDPIFRPKKDVIDPDGLLRKAAIPLQAADLLAYESFDPMRKIEQDGYIRRIKKTFEELHKIPGEVGLVKPTHLDILQQGMKAAEKETLNE